MVWDGVAWVPQNNLDDLRKTVRITTTCVADLQKTADGLNSYVASLTETVEVINDGLSEGQERLISAESQISDLKHTRAMHSCRNPTPWTSSPRRKNKMGVKSRSIM